MATDPPFTTLRSTRCRGDGDRSARHRFVYSTCGQAVAQRIAGARLLIAISLGFMRSLPSIALRGRAGRSTPCGRSTCRRGWWVARSSRGLAASDSPASAVASASRCHHRLLEHSLSLVKPSKLSLQSPVWPSRVGRQRRSRHQSPCAPPPNGREGSLPRPRLDCIHAHPPPGRP